jgi:hypothetical protein
MAKMRRTDSKVALGNQRAELRQGSRHPQFVGADAAAGAARAAERAKVRDMQRERQGADREAMRLEQVLRDRAAERRSGEPLSALLADLVGDSVRLARTLLSLPLRMLAVLRRHRPNEA